MKCGDCGASLQGDLTLECEACGYFAFECDCDGTPNRVVTCRGCDRIHITTVDTTAEGWRSLEV